MKILALDSSNQALSVALVEDGRLQAETLLAVKKNHSISLMPVVDFWWHRWAGHPKTWIGLWSLRDLAPTRGFVWRWRLPRPWPTPSRSTWWGYPAFSPWFRPA